MNQQRNFWELTLCYFTLDLAKEIHKINCPSLIIYGMKDPFF